MPDWTYHPLLRPAGIALHGSGTRGVTMAHLRRVASTPVGRWLIRAMGHSSPDPRLLVSRSGIHSVTPVMLTHHIDAAGIATRAFDQMEVGLIEVDDATNVPEAVRAQIVERFSGTVSSRAQVVRCELEQINRVRTQFAGPILCAIQAGQSLPTSLDPLLHLALDTDDVTHVRSTRAMVGPGPVIAAGKTVRSPRDALALRQAGADIVMVGEGLATAGPNLFKRIDEVLLAHETVPEPAPLRHWVAGSIFGLGAVLAAALATYIALTTVILAYDEHFAGLTREELPLINERLPHFMRHDRLSYAGATLSVAVFYLSLAYFGIRRREKWAFHTFAAAGAAGFIVFLAFIPFGYLDVGNAAVALGLLVPFLYAVVKPPLFVSPGNVADLDNDRAWKLGLYGQLLLVVLGVGLIIGGLLICVVGTTNVFVISDLDYLETTAEALMANHDNLLPLIAHDRFSFGGAIVCNGIAVTLMALWGFKRGHHWVWWAILIAGAVNLGFTLYAHFSSGYLELGHLIPVFVGAGFFAAGLVLSRPYLLARTPR